MEEIILKEDVKIRSSLCSRAYTFGGQIIGVMIKVKRGDFNPEIYCTYCSNLNLKCELDKRDCLYKNLRL